MSQAKEESYAPSPGFHYSGQKKRVMVSSPAPKMTPATLFLLQAQLKPNQTQISLSSGQTPENCESCRITRCLIPFPEEHKGFPYTTSYEPRKSFPKLSQAAGIQRLSAPEPHSIYCSLNTDKTMLV